MPPSAPYPATTIARINRSVRPLEAMCLVPPGEWFVHNQGEEVHLQANHADTSISYSITGIHARETEIVRNIAPIKRMDCACEALVQIRESLYFGHRLLSYEELSQFHYHSPF